MRRFSSIILCLSMCFVILTFSCGKDKKSPTEPSNETHEIHGITFVSIPGGTFEMGDEDGDLHSSCRPVHTVTLDGFEMSTTEITNAQYATYLNEALGLGDITATSSSVKGSRGDYNGQKYIYLSGYYSSYPDNDCKITYSTGAFNVKQGYENWPVTWVTWYGAEAFAVYYGLDLPTEAEWEYAARGRRQYKYATDDGTINTSKANYRDTGINHPVDVGSYASNPFGLFDMSGNVWEWCNDWYVNYTSESVTNPTGAHNSSHRVLRGGCWNSFTYYCRAAERFGSGPGYGYGRVGFRVVRRPGGVTY